LAGAEGSVMGFMASYFRIRCQVASPYIKGMAHNIYVTKLVEPKVVHCVGCGHKVAFAELLVGLCSSDVKFVQNPLLDETLVPSGLLPDRKVRRVVSIQDENKLWVLVRV
jgi:hypothetical protein